MYARTLPAIYEENGACASQVVDLQLTQSLPETVLRNFRPSSDFSQLADFPLMGVYHLHSRELPFSRLVPSSVSQLLAFISEYKQSLLDDHLKYRSWLHESYGDSMSRLERRRSEEKINQVKEVLRLECTAFVCGEYKLLKEESLYSVPVEQFLKNDEDARITRQLADQAMRNFIDLL